MRILITGGAGFIGSALARTLVRETSHEVLVVDALTYAGSMTTLAEVLGHERFGFAKLDIRDAARVDGVFATFRPDAVMHLAAESHVDRSVDAPGAFLATNIEGTYVLLDAALRHFDALEGEARDRFRFLHVSTDEVFGSLGAEGAFTEHTAYAPRSPYSASKAASDHLVSAWHHTYGLPTLTTNCSNNYGPYQFPEKLIPLMIQRALAGEALPVYGSGANVRDWLHVEDHVSGLLAVLERGRPGETYCLGGRAERRNLDLVHTLCAALDLRAPRADGRAHADAIAFVADRPGHDARYAVDCSKAERELGWVRRWGFEDGLDATVAWYLEHRHWLGVVARESYDGARLGLARTGGQAA